MELGYDGARQSAPLAVSAAATLNAAAKQRIQSIDALRGAVMLLMLVDHVREFFFLHAQVPDPMDISTTSPGLFASRLLAHFCAPAFIVLTGLSAWLYSQSRGGKAAASAFLFKRGLFLIVLELTVVSFAWTFSLPPQTLFLQVIWVIGLSMIALSALLWLPRAAVLAIGLLIVLGHNFLDPIAFAAGEPGHAIWAILHDRGYIELTETVRARTSYPLLPWIGVIALGWCAGPWFGRNTPAGVRRGRLILVGCASVALFALLRATNIYGDPYPWLTGASALQTVMSFFNVTKYPPSADFILLTLGVGALVLAWLEKVPTRGLATIAVFGAAPLFFYVIHLYVLHLLNLAALAAFGPNQGAYFSLANVGALWLLSAVVAVPLWFLCRWFVGVKRRSGNTLLSYL
ncbi:DUF1624 domain-containing protein [Croceibacterium soli]|uniref:DUF1624 domain-containing protein n=1 Tax=Croceibacterium soli TaxID=1739690 RepID=UPI002E25F65B